MVFFLLIYAVPLERPERPSSYDPAGAVIRQLEASLAGSPTKSEKTDEAALAAAAMEENKQEQKGWWKPWTPKNANSNQP